MLRIELEKPGPGPRKRKTYCTLTELHEIQSAGDEKTGKVPLNISSSSLGEWESDTSEWQGEREKRYKQFRRET